MHGFLLDRFALHVVVYTSPDEAYTKKRTGCIPFSTTKVSNIPTSTSKQFVKGCCIVLVTSCLSQVDHFGIFPLKMYLFLHAFLRILFFAKIDWSELAKLIQKLRVGSDKEFHTSCDKRSFRESKREKKQHYAVLHLS